MKPSHKIVLLLSMVVIATGCQKEENPTSAFPVTIEDLEKADLGRVLFYDKQLSVNQTVSCASCHQQKFAFADNKPFSMGFDGQLTLRNSMPIHNLGGDMVPLFWDGRESQLSKMVVQPILNHIEMGFDSMDDVVLRVQRIPYYPALFKGRYGNDEITSDKIAIALASFVGSIGTDVDPVGHPPTGQLFDEDNLTPLQIEGMMLFESKYRCNDCHGVDRPLGYLDNPNRGFANIGLDANPPDPGLADITKFAPDRGKFKIPSLKNVALTAPYMHDGRFQTLEEVIEHYSTGLQPDPNLDFRFRGPVGAPLKLDITEDEKKAIVAFLHAMTDFQIIDDPDLSDPFARR